MHIDTKCIHSGGYPDTQTKGINTPIFTSSAYEYLDTDVRLYQRYFNTPNQEAVAKKLCEMEGAEGGVVFSSGMAAISTVLLTLLNSGDHAVIQDEIYGGSHAFVEDHFSRLGISFTLTGKDAQEIEEAVKPNTRLIYIESPTNPLLNVVGQPLQVIRTTHGVNGIANTTLIGNDLLGSQSYLNRLLGG